MTRRKGELTGSRIDRERPHQVALPADQAMGKNYLMTHDFYRDLSPGPRGHTVQRDNIPYIVFCLASQAHADLFRERSGGEQFDPRGGDAGVSGLCGGSANDGARDVGNGGCS